MGLRLSHLISSPLDMPIYIYIYIYGELASKGIAVDRTEGVTAGRSVLVALLDCFKAVHVVHMPTHFLLPCLGEIIGSEPYPHR